MDGAPQTGTSLLGRTAWARNLQTPLREFLRTETGGAAFLLAATLAALVWANVDAASYESFWRTRLSVVIGGWGVSQDLRHWVNTGLMKFFFFVVGLEARREFDMGELRERHRFMLPLLAGVAGMAFRWPSLQRSTPATVLCGAGAWRCRRDGVVEGREGGRRPRDRRCLRRALDYPHGDSPGSHPRVTTEVPPLG